MTWDEIGLASHFHPTYCSAIFTKAQVVALSSETVEKSRSRLLSQLDQIANVLRPASFAAAGFLPDDTQVKLLLKILDRKARLLGVDLHDLTEVEDEDLTEDPETPPGEFHPSVQRWLTLSRAFAGGLIEMSSEGARVTGFPITARGREVGFNFEPGWEYRFKDCGTDKSPHPPRRDPPADFLRLIAELES